MSVSITTFGIIDGDITTLGIITGILSIEDITPPEVPPNYQGAGAGSSWGWNDPPKNFASKYKKIKINFRFEGKEYSEEKTISKLIELNITNFEIKVVNNLPTVILKNNPKLINQI